MSESPVPAQGDPAPSPPVPLVPPPLLPPVLPVRAPGFGASLGLLGIYVGFLIGLQVVITVVQMIRQAPQPGAWAMFWSMIVALGLTLAFVPLLLRIPWREVFPRWSAPAVALPGTLLLSLGGWLLALEIGVMTERLIPMPEFMAREFDRLFVQSTPLASLLLLTVAPPLAEEILCRGFILRSLLARWRPAGAISVSALIFGVMHLNPWQFFYAVWLGMLIGWVYWRTRSLGLCVLMHALNNFLSWLATRAQPTWMGLDRPDYLTAPDHLAPLLQVTGVGLVIAGLACLVRIPAVTSDPGSATVAPG